MLKEGDLLTIQTGDIGVTAVVPKDLEGTNCHALIISRFIRSVAEPYFFCHFFNSHIGRNHLQRIETGTTMKHLNTGDIAFLPLPLPPLPGQHRIATVLSTLDECIEKTEALIAKLKQVKAGLMQDLLTWGIDDEGRIRDESTHEFKDTEIGRVPVEWEVYKIGDVLIDKIIIGYSGVETTQDKGIPTLTLSAVTNNSISKREYQIL